MVENKPVIQTSTLIVGYGYLGKRVADALLRQNPENVIFATTRSKDKAELIARAAVQPIVADWTDRRSLKHLPCCNRVLVAVSYDPSSGRTRDESQVGGLSNLLDFVSPTADICYISTTGVYHQVDGSWVDENSPTRPRAVGGMAHLRAESLLHCRRPGNVLDMSGSRGRWTILRLAGIYGPGRIPRVNDVNASRPIDGPDGGYLNLIHVDDAVSAVLAAWDCANRSNLYAVADDQPVIRRMFYEQIAKLAGAPSPIFATKSGRYTPAAILSSRSLSNKRIWNRRFRRDLLPRLAYRDYIDGLNALSLSTYRSPTKGVVAHTE